MVSINSVMTRIASIVTGEPWTSINLHCWFAVSAMWFFGSWHMVAIFVALAALKEFVWDVKYEGATIVNGAIDFAGYLLGMTIGAIKISLV